MYTRETSIALCITILLYMSGKIKRMKKCATLTQINANMIVGYSVGYRSLARYVLLSSSIVAFLAMQS